MTDMERETVYLTAVEQLQIERSQRLEQARTLGGVNTPSLRDMRAMSRAVGVVDLLLEHQRIVLSGHVGDAYDLVESVLITLGISSAELLTNLQKAEG